MMDSTEWDLHEPWEWEALGGHLDDLEELLARFVAFPSDHCRVAVVLWAVHAHALDAAESTPRLSLPSAEKQSGKTRCLEVLELVVPRPMMAVSATPAAIFRKVADTESRPTVLFDEADTYFGSRTRDNNEELRGLVNAGHRRGAVAYRCVGDPANMRVESFPAFAAVALAGIGDLPDTIMDRSVVVRIRRRAPDEVVEQFRYGRVSPIGHALRDRLADWASPENVERLGDLEPAMPAGLTDRPADVWEPLLAIADAAGGPWSARARAAAAMLNGARAEDDQSIGVRLLTDLRTVFDGHDRLRTPVVLEKLCQLEEAPWGDWYGREFTSRLLAAKLRPFSIKPGRWRDGGETHRGYLRVDLEDPWRRYLPASSGEPAHPAHSDDNPAHGTKPAPSDACQDSDVPLVPLVPGASRADSDPVPDADSVPGYGHDEPAPDLTDEQLNKAPVPAPLPDRILELLAHTDQADDDEPAARPPPLNPSALASIPSSALSPHP